MSRMIRVLIFTLVLSMFLFSLAYAEKTDKASKMLESIRVYPADTKNPRSVLESFLFLTQSYFDLIKDNGFTDENIEELNSIKSQVMKLFDMRSVPPRFQEAASMEAAVYLREALERVPLPPLDNVPGEDEMAEIIEHGTAPFYRIPATLIEIERISEGPYKGHYQFTKDTLENAELIYDQSEEYPPQRINMEGFYEAYFLTPGPMIPYKWIRSLPNWMMEEFVEQTVWQWILFIISFIVFVVFIILLSLMIKYITRNMNPLQRNMLVILRPIAVIFFTVGLISFLEKQVFLTGAVLQMVAFVGHLVVLYCSIVITLVTSKIVAELILISDRFKRTDINQHLIRIGVRLLGVGVVIIILFQGLQRLGFSLATVLAGASVTGLAVALAAQDTLRNIFGSIMILLDKPFVVGQRVVVKGHDGKIEEIGMRSTRMRTMSGHLVSIPNDDLAKMDIENIGSRDYIRRKFNVTITYDTPPDKITRAVEIIKEILSVPESVLKKTESEKNEEETKPHPNTAINKQLFLPRVFFNDFNADSLNIVVYYWYCPPDRWEYLAHAEMINMQLIKRFADEGIEFAFPTQTLYLAGDEKRPLTVGQR